MQITCVCLWFHSVAKFEFAQASWLFDWYWLASRLYAGISRAFIREQMGEHMRGSNKNWRWCSIVMLCIQPLNLFPNASVWWSKITTTSIQPLKARPGLHNKRGKSTYFSLRFGGFGGRGVNAAVTSVTGLNKELLGHIAPNFNTAHASQVAILLAYHFWWWE